MSWTPPVFLQQLLREQYGEETALRAESGMAVRRPVSLRVNTLKSTPEEVRAALDTAGLRWENVPWSPDALILPEDREPALRALPIYTEGKIYLQSLSAMIPPLVLDPQPGESILDMAAAPGGKTTQMAALTGGKAGITACEKNAARAEKLRYNLRLQGAGRVSVLVQDARKLDNLFSFDRILLDAPCSGSGTLGPGRGEFSEDLFQRSQRFQAELLRKALRLLKKGHRMVYSTCSILEGENEGILRRVLPGSGARTVPIPEDAFPGVPPLPVTLPGTLCICPDLRYEGFFVALLEKS